ncbi:bifunctional 2-keto-4-hydroxyglutarate aldolase/2-keto-3-deoxy-6-phosphogluconate aldolase [Gracilibacillus massiliensis]|uniref:bifunctional 2-keto-4-hydroxyglutarate aldolase/2-keto-3-deoxy-6-phosphogluconate aldolase n=1 Tax=Gracilibacillus massiliensis TaxID=1564956 RepID=UPI00071CB4DA|nr:bifunctional 2-keto-4-hydroxyglutarate aldolase/2-keto-3-deoxy-6-phosphogluconate aldolase [Gracilibacillus massiliensis]
MKKTEILNRLVHVGIIAVVRGESKKRAIEVSSACINGGVKAIEITYTLPEASDVIKKLKANNEDNNEVVIGAGTVLDSQTARLAILSGAEFIVSPSFDFETAKLCNRYHIPYIPGCMSITEIVKASEAGCDVIKLFPSRFFTPAIVNDIKAPLPNVEVMPSGGVNLNNIEEWINKGAIVAGVGGQLTNGTSKEIIETAEKFVRIVKEARGVHQ